METTDCQVARKNQIQGFRGFVTMFRGLVREGIPNADQGIIKASIFFYWKHHLDEFVARQRT